MKNCLRTNKYTNLQYKLNTLLSPVGTLELLMEYLELAKELVLEEEKCKVFKDLTELKAFYKKNEDTLVHYQLLESFIEYYKNEKYIEHKLMYDSLLRLNKSYNDPYIVYSVYSLLEKYSLLETSYINFPHEYSAGLTEEENINVYIDILSRDVAAYLEGEYTEALRYIPHDYLVYSINTYIRDFYDIVLTLDSFLSFEDIVLKLKKDL